MGFILALIPLLLVGFMLAWGFIIGTRNVIIRISGVVLSLIGAIIAVITLKNLGFSSVSPLLKLILSQTEIGDSVLDYLMSAEMLGDAMLSLVSALAAPLVFAAAFIVFAIITWFIGLIVGLVLMLVGAGKDGKKRSASVIIPCTVAQALITAFVLITPIAAYGTFANSIAHQAERYEDGLKEYGDLVSEIDSMDSSPTVAVYRFAGGNAVCKWLTSFEIGGEKSNLAQEADSIGRVTADVLYLAGQEISEYGDEEAKALRDLSDSLSDSVVIPALTGEVIYYATDAWLDDNGDFFGVDAPDLDEMGAGIFDESFVHLLEIFHDDARDRDELCADFETVTNTVVILAEDGIFRAIGEGENTLVEKLSEGTTVSKLVAEFGSNPGFKILIGDITNIGMRVIGTALNIPENADKVYSDFTGSVANELNSLNASDKDLEEKCAKLAETIKKALADAGIAAEIDDEVLKLYARMIIADFGSDVEVTAEDISEFFRAYSEVNSAINSENVKMEGGVALLSGSGSYEYSSEVYAGKSVDELRTQSGAGLLAEIMNAVLDAQKNGAADLDEIRRMIKEEYINYAEAVGKDPSEANEFFDSVALSADAITNELVSLTASMCSSGTMAESSSVVTVNDLLVNSKELAETLESEEDVAKEAEAIGNVFNSMVDIVSLIGESADSMQTDDLSDVAESIGEVLDNLSETGAVGSDNTGRLMTAIMQSESVRNAADLDMATATEIAKAATETEDGKVNYKETMEGIASGAGIAEKLADESKELTREDIRELLDNMTPQTAKVLNAYMTEKRIAGFGVPENKVQISTEMVNSLLTEMGNKEKYSSDYESEVDGITTLFDLLNAATSKDNAGKAIFNHGSEVGRLNSDAYDFTGTILSSDMVCNALERSLNKNGTLAVDPFGLNLNENGRDYAAAKDALDRHYSESSYNRVNLIAALFGIER